MAKPETIIRKMQTEDLPTVMLIEEASFSVPWSEESMREELTAENRIYLVAVTAGKISGYAGLWCVCDEGQITNVAVRPSMRGQGIARLLMNRLLEEGKQASLEKFTLEVRVSNKKAIRLYQSLGFYSVGTRKSFYTKPIEDAVIMWT